MLCKKSIVIIKIFDFDYLIYLCVLRSPEFIYAIFTMIWNFWNFYWYFEIKLETGNSNAFSSLDKLMKYIVGKTFWNCLLQLKSKNSFFRRISLPSSFNERHRRKSHESQDCDMDKKFFRKTHERKRKRENKMKKTGKLFFVYVNESLFHLWFLFKRYIVFFSHNFCLHILLLASFIK